MTHAQYTTTKALPKGYSNETLRTDTFVYGRLVEGRYVTQQQPATYRALQRELTSLGLSASGTANVLRGRLWEYEHDNDATIETPLTRSQRSAMVKDISRRDECPTVGETQAANLPTPKVVAIETQPATLDAIAATTIKPIAPTYRHRQRLVKWMRENDKWTPARKNVGAANVAANVEDILGSDRFWALMANEGYVAQLNAFVGYEVV